MEVPRLADRQFQRERRIHMRRPRAAKVFDTALNRDFVNDGVIEIANDSSDDESEFEEIDVSGVVYRLPEKGIKLDFIDRVRRSVLLQRMLKTPLLIALQNSSSRTVLQQSPDILSSQQEKKGATPRREE